MTGTGQLFQRLPGGDLSQLLCPLGFLVVRGGSEVLDPVEIAYRQHACAGPGSEQLHGMCCRCGRRDQVLPTRAVVSAKFTGFDQFHDGEGLCACCAWSFSAAARPMVLSITPMAATMLDTPSLFQCLQHPAGQAALVVPIGGRKHVLPYAQWGTIRVDDINLSWRTTDAKRLLLVAELRLRGAPALALHEPSPPSRWLTTQPPSTWESTYQQWRELDPWRATPYLHLAIKATHHLKGNQ